MAETLELDPHKLTRHLVRAMATLANALDTDLGDTDWGRILDALLLIVTHPEPDQQTRTRTRI